MYDRTYVPLGVECKGRRPKITVDGIAVDDDRSGHASISWRNPQITLNYERTLALQPGAHVEDRARRPLAAARRRKPALVECLRSSVRALAGKFGQDIAKLLRAGVGLLALRLGTLLPHAHLGDIAACAKSHDLTPDAEKIASNGLNSRFSQGRLRVNRVSLAMSKPFPLYPS